MTRDDADTARAMSVFMQRRSFLASAGAAAVGAAVPAIFTRTARAQVALTPAQPSRAELAALLQRLLVSKQPELREFATEVFATCVLGKIKPADPPLAYPWIVPGGGYYAQWLWDTMFVVDLYSLLPDTGEIIRGVFQNYWDFQRRWNAVKPEFMHGMVANFMAPYDAPGARDGKQWREFPAYSQAPLLAWGMERVYLRNGDKALLHAGIAPLEAFHEWYWRERDILDLGLVGVGAYSGDTQHARYETYDREVDLDKLKMMPHPGRSAGVNNGTWYGDIAIPANTAYLLLSELALARMARAMGDKAMAARRMARYEHGATAMRKYMWDEKAGCFLAVQVQTLAKQDTATVGSFMPLMAHVPSASQASAMASALTKPAWATPLPIPTVARSDPRFVSGEFWRGDVWPAPNYQVASGLALYGHHDVAAGIADATVTNALEAGISERYDSLTGAALGVSGLGMSATTLSMVLDGLTSDRYTMRTLKPL